VNQEQDKEFQEKSKELDLQSKVLSRGQVQELLVKSNVRDLLNRERSLEQQKELKVKKIVVELQKKAHKLVPLQGLLVRSNVQV
jgi:hypothetical protein